MNKWHLVFLLLILFANSAFGAMVFERSFGEMGHDALVVEGPGERACLEIPFVFPQDVNFMAGENYPIASLQLQLLPVRGKNFYVDVKLNDENVGTFFTESFFCQEECWLRVFLPKELLEEVENELKVCLKNSADVSESVLGKESMIGIYHTVDFFREDAFEETVERSEIVIGEKVKITMLLHNDGSASSFVEMKHARALAEDKEAFVVVDGNTYFKGFVKPGETVAITYTIKPRVLGPISLPPAIVYYSNEFGEPQQRFGKMVTINVKEPERKVNAFVVKESEINRVGTTTQLQLAVKNNGRDPLFNLGIHLTLPEGLSLIEEPDGLIDVLQPDETRYLDFSARALQPGEYKIGCSVTYIDLNASESKCEQLTLLFEEQEIPAELWIGLALVIIAVVVYLYIQSGK